MAPVEEVEEEVMVVVMGCVEKVEVWWWVICPSLAVVELACPPATFVMVVVPAESVSILCRKGVKRTWVFKGVLGSFGVFFGISGCFF